MKRAANGVSVGFTANPAKKNPSLEVRRQGERIILLGGPSTLKLGASMISSSRSAV